MATTKTSVPKKSILETMYGKQKKMIDAKTAVKAAIAYLRGFSDTLFANDIRLEEVELNETMNTWFVTLSFAESVVHDRQYKQFSVDAKTGKVEAMRIRSIPA